MAGRALHFESADPVIDAARELFGDKKSLFEKHPVSALQAALRSFKNQIISKAFPKLQFLGEPPLPDKLKSMVYIRDHCVDHF
jgi:hypothetical protein